MLIFIVENMKPFKELCHIITMNKRFTDNFIIFQYCIHLGLIKTVIFFTIKLKYTVTQRSTSNLQCNHKFDIN